MVLRLQETKLLTLHPCRQVLPASGAAASADSTLSPVPPRKHPRKKKKLKTGASSGGAAKAEGVRVVEYMHVKAAFKKLREGTIGNIEALQQVPLPIPLCARPSIQLSVHPPILIHGALAVTVLWWKVLPPIRGLVVQAQGDATAAFATSALRCTFKVVLLSAVVLARLLGFLFGKYPSDFDVQVHCDEIVNLDPTTNATW